MGSVERPWKWSAVSQLSLLWSRQYMLLQGPAHTHTPLSYTLTHTHTYARTHVQTDTHTHTHSHTPLQIAPWLVQCHTHPVVKPSGMLSSMFYNTTPQHTPAHTHTHLPPTYTHTLPSDRPYCVILALVSPPAPAGSHPAVCMLAQGSS